jgi:hypothetical protein
LLTVKKSSALSSIIRDCSVAAHDPGEAAETVAECHLVRIEESFGVVDGSDHGIGILAAVLPGEDSAIGHDALGIGFAGPEVKEIAAMSHPLIEDTGRKIFVEPELKINMRIDDLPPVALPRRNRKGV